MVALTEPRPLRVDREPAGDWKVAEVLEHFRRGNQLSDDGEFAGALAEYDAALRSVPDDPAFLNNRGAALSRLGRDNDALAAYERVLLLSPDDPVALHNRGVALAQLGRYEEAVAAYDRALALVPDDAGTLANLGLALAHLGHYVKALAILNRSLEQRPGEAKVIAARRTILDNILRGLRRSGVVSWAGGKPQGSNPPIPITPGPPVSDYVIEDRW